MTRLLEQAIETVSTLPDDTQDELARILLQLAGVEQPPYERHVGKAWPVKVRYTRRALRQMTEVLEYIEARSPSGAENVKRRLQGIIDLLADHPNSGPHHQQGQSPPLHGNSVPLRNLLPCGRDRDRYSRRSPCCTPLPLNFSKQSGWWTQVML